MHKANGVCTRTQARVDAVWHSSAHASQRAVLAKLLAITDAQVKQLDALTPPAALQHRYSQLRAALKIGRDALERGAAGVHPPKSATAREWARLHSITRIEKGLGLTACV